MISSPNSSDPGKGGFTAVLKVPVREHTGETGFFRVGFAACTGLMNGGGGNGEKKDAKEAYDEWSCPFDAVRRCDDDEFTDDIRVCNRAVSRMPFTLSRQVRHSNENLPLYAHCSVPLPFLKLYPWP